jgi:hypothetical protein
LFGHWEILVKNQIAFCAAVLACGSLFGQAATPWQSAARWRRTLEKPVPGTLLIDDAGVEFRSARLKERWAWIEISSFDLAGRELTLISYQNRPWREPGDRRFHFILTEPVPPTVASEMALRVARPVRNEDPQPEAPATAEIPAHRRAFSGGSNGILRLKNDGIDYLTKDGRDAHSWRWDDIETIANPSPWELRVGGYREIAEFDLKQPISRELFERIWDRLYGGRR